MSTPPPDQTPEVPDDASSLGGGPGAQPAPGSTTPGFGWAHVDPALRDLKPSCGAIYRTAAGVFVVCDGEQGHDGKKCSGEGYQWKFTEALKPSPGTPVAAPVAQGTPAGPVPTPRTREELEAELLAALSSNTDRRYTVRVHFGQYGINPDRIDPTLLNDVDRAMLAALLRAAADRLEPPVAAAEAPAPSGEEQQA